MISIGVLSDTHINCVNEEFMLHTQHAFSECDVIIHAGDLTDSSILSAFLGKEVHAVCGNSCNYLTQNALPEKKIIILEGYSFGVCHGTGNRLNIEDRMYTLFPECNCVIFGHTHIPVNHKVGNTLLLNPGSFSGTGRFGAAGTFGIIKIQEDGLEATIHNL